MQQVRTKVHRYSTKGTLKGMSRRLMMLLTIYVPFVRTFCHVSKVDGPCLRNIITSTTTTSKSRRFASIIPTDSSSSRSSLSSSSPPPVSSFRPFAENISSSQLLNYYSTSDEEISTIFKSIGQPAFRCKQVKQWVYEKGVIDFNQMNNLPSTLRKSLSEIFHFGSLKLVSEQVVYTSNKM